MIAQMAKEEHCDFIAEQIEKHRPIGKLKCLAFCRNVTHEDKLEKILENPSVIKTPVVRNGKQSTLGYQPEVWKGWS